MLLGILRMPLPDDPSGMDWITWYQFRSRARQAADEIEELRAENNRLNEVLLQSNHDDKTDNEINQTLKERHYFPRERQAIELPCHTCQSFRSVTSGWLCDDKQPEFPHLCAKYNL